MTLTIAGPVRTYFAQRTEMKQLAASEAALRHQITDLEQQKGKLGDPAYIAAQARERLGFVMPGEIPYQVQLPPGAALPADPGAQPKAARQQRSLVHVAVAHHRRQPARPAGAAATRTARPLAARSRAAQPVAARWLIPPTSRRWPVSSAASRVECSTSPTGAPTVSRPW